MSSRTGFAIGVVCILNAACGISDSVQGSTSQTIVSAPPGIWVSAEGGYGTACDCTTIPDGGCGCVEDRCNGDPDGQPCGPIGASCNVVGQYSYEILTCVTPPQDPNPNYRWTRTTTDTCFDACGRSARDCSCLQPICDGNPENQVCSAPGASCDVVSGSTWFELNCE